MRVLVLFPADSTEVEWAAAVYERRLAFDEWFAMPLDGGPDNQYAYDYYEAADQAATELFKQWNGRL